MSTIKKSLSILVAASVLSITGLSGVAFATSPSQQTSDGQFTGGNIYYVKDETQNSSWGNTISGVNQCDTLEYKVYLYNPGPSFLSNVEAKVSLPSTSTSSNTSTVNLSSINAFPQSVSANSTVNLTSSQSISYVSGSTELLDQSNNLIKNLPDGLTQGGLNIGDLGASQTEFLRFLAKVNCPPAPQPAPQPTYSCTALGVEGEANQTIKITSFTTAQDNGATLSSATIDWGDNTALLNTTQPVGSTHQYANAGTYTITATANFSVNGTNQSVTSPSCKQTISISVPTTTTTTTTPTPTKLVNTGPGNVIGTFIGISIAGGIGYNLFIRRKLSRNI